MSADYPQPQSPAPQGPYMQPGVQPGPYYPPQGQQPQGQPQYTQATQQGPGLSAFPGQMLGMITAVAGGVLALLGLIMALAGDPIDKMGAKAVTLGNNLLLGGIFLLGIWLLVAMREKADKK